METGLIGFTAGMLLCISIYMVGGWSGLAAERRARIRRAAFRAKRTQWELR